MKWLWVYYFHAANLGGVSSVRLHRGIGAIEKTAWFMLHSIRRSCEGNDPLFNGVVEVDETCIGGEDRNKHHSKRSEGIQRLLRVRPLRWEQRNTARVG